MTAWLRIALAVQVGFFGIWGASLLTSHRGAPEVWLSIIPIDPRDLLSGHYVALRYDISPATAAGCEVGEGRSDPRDVYVRLEKNDDAFVLTKDGPVETWKAAECRDEAPPLVVGAIWIKGRLGAASRRGDIAYGIERFFVPEDSPLRTVQNGHVVANVAIDDAHEARIVNLVPTVQPTDPAR